MKKTFYILLTVLLLVFALPVTAFAAGEQDGRVVLGSNFILESGDTLEGDLAIIGGTATLEPESTVTGSVVVVGGNLEADGLIEEDLAVVGGNANLGPEAVIGGDLVTFGGNINRGMAQVEGDVISGEELDFPFSFRFERWFEGPLGFAPAIRTSFVWRVGQYIFQSVMLAALAMLVTMFFPKQTRLVADTILEQPVLAGAFGLLTVIVGTILFVLLIVTICLAVAGVAGIALLVAGWVFGLIALGLEIGERLGNALNRSFQPVMAAGLGTLVLTLVINGIGFIACVGWLVPFLVGAVGLGAVLMTRYGSRPYASAAVEEPPAPKKRSTKKS